MADEERLVADRCKGRDFARRGVEIVEPRPIDEEAQAVHGVGFSGERRRVAARGIGAHAHEIP